MQRDADTDVAALSSRIATAHIRIATAHIRHPLADVATVIGAILAWAVNRVAIRTPHETKRLSRERVERDRRQHPRNKGLKIGSHRAIVRQTPPLHGEHRDGHTALREGAAGPGHAGPQDLRGRAPRYEDAGMHHDAHQKLIRPGRLVSGPRWSERLLRPERIGPGLPRDRDGRADFP